MKHNKNTKSLSQFETSLSLKDMLSVNGGAKKPPPVGTTLSYSNGVLLLTSSYGSFVYDSSTDSYILVVNMP